jgi:hypothetical protein
MRGRSGMHGKNLIGVGFGVLLCLVFHEGESRQKAAIPAKGERTVKTIDNPLRPLYGDLSFDLEEVWTLGKEKKPEDLFASVFDLQVDGRGNVFVSDLKDNRVKEFDAVGNYVRDIGRRGQGPGEFQGARNLAVEDSSGDVYLTDLLKVHRYDRNGVFQSDVPIQGYLEKLSVDADNQIWGTMSFLGASGMDKGFIKISPKGEILMTIVTVSDQAGLSVKPAKQQGQVTVVSVHHGYENEMIVSGIDGKSFLWAFSNEYALNIVGLDGEPTARILKQEAPQPFSRAEREKILSGFRPQVRDKIELPKYKPFMNKIITDDVGRIYVQRVRSPLAAAGDLEYDVFCRSGFYLYRTHFIAEIAIIKAGFLYSSVKDPETSYQLVKKYRIKNWDRIKKEREN